MRAFSPEAVRPPLWAIAHADAADHAACRAAIRTGSRSFFAASALLPAAVRRPAYGLYAFCRLSDDAVDEVAANGRAAAVARLSARLARAYDGRPADTAADRALADIVADHAIPQALPGALIEGLAWDAQGRRYETLSELSAYAARVAASVGAMMTLIMGVRDPGTLARACDLGVAMQFTNIARDVGEDARAGRLYLPLRWLAEEGIDADAFLADPTPSPALARVVGRLLAAADLLYARAQSGVSGLPLSCRPAIRAAGSIYSEIGRELERAGLDPITSRARVAGRRKGVLLAKALLLGASGGARTAPPLPETAFLVDAVAAQPVPVRASWWDVPAQAGRVLDLVEILRARESFGSQGFGSLAFASEEANPAPS
ncbi:phytoene/squalene synthase family protein [Methylobacterium sp. BTF04]|uniref:phytoene/squalene synthase family protein n=1 Tax=Methylobacterium sp. BTF04 TaxID=2708300 RepID=UPI0013D0716A|nr:phytoene/squalene synthase family protein [Methylobacterium sp. BTF04]NEU11067.1 phytoene/squalene synthase family protein [Methylobacterium sp. BTF04]